MARDRATSQYADPFARLERERARRALVRDSSARGAIEGAPTRPGRGSLDLGYTGQDLIRDDERADALSVERTPLLKPRHVSRRIAAQDGWFSLHRAHANDAGISFVSLDSNQAYKDRLHYVRIPARAFGRMRTELKIAGVSRAVLFPDLEGVAGVVTAMHLYPDDEIPARLGSL